MFVRKKEGIAARQTGGLRNPQLSRDELKYTA